MAFEIFVWKTYSYIDLSLSLSAAAAVKYTVHVPRNSVIDTNGVIHMRQHADSDRDKFSQTYPPANRCPHQPRLNIECDNSCCRLYYVLLLLKPTTFLHGAQENCFFSFSFLKPSISRIRLAAALQRFSVKTLGSFKFPVTSRSRVFHNNYREMYSVRLVFLLPCTFVFYRSALVKLS